MVKTVEESKIFDKYIKENINRFSITDENNTIVINESDIFGDNNTQFNSADIKINGKRVTIKIKKEKKIFARCTLSAQQAARYYGRTCTAPFGAGRKNLKTSCHDMTRSTVSLQPQQAAGY